MNHLNSILIEGDLVSDAVRRVTKAGTGVCNFTIASSRFYKGADGAMVKEVCFFDITAWGKLAETCAELGKEGRGVRLVGRLHQERWNDVSGVNLLHSKINIVAEHAEFRPLVNKETEAPVDEKEAACE
jgi:single-strand DNA-binding protein